MESELRNPFAELLGSLACVEVTGAPAPTPETAKVILRAKDLRRWGGIVLLLLRSAAEGDEFEFSVRKEYFLAEDGTPSFAWVVLAWGDLEAAADALAEVVEEAKVASTAPTKRVPPPEVEAPAIERASRITSRMAHDQDGNEFEVKTIPLPHTRGVNRNRKGRKHPDGTPVRAHVSGGITRDDSDGSRLGDL